MTLPAADLIGSATRRTNPARKRTSPAIVEPDDLLTPWSGHEGYVVRTVLLRAAEYPKLAGNPAVIRSARDIATLCSWLRSQDQEHVCVVCLGINNELKALHDTSAGTATSSVVEASQVARVALLVGAPAVALVHNHPSGNMTPSQQDITLTNKLHAHLTCIGITLVDHVIVAGREGYTSFLERGLMPGA